MQGSTSSDQVGTNLGPGVNHVATCGPRGEQVGTPWGVGTTQVVPTWSPRGPHMVPTWSPLGPHVLRFGFKVPTWSPLWSPRGPHVVPTWSPRGPHLVPTWSPRGSHLVPVWESRGNHVGTTWGPRENLRSVAFSVFSACSRPRRPLVASLRQSWLLPTVLTATMRWVRLWFGRGLPAHRPTSGQLSRRTLRCIIRSASVRA